MTPYHDALLKCALRYGAMAAPLIEPRLLTFIDEFEAGCRKGMPVPKLCRWLGYIQGVLIDRNITTVEKERDWTRPLFRPLDFPEI